MKSIEIPMSVPVGTVIDFAGINIPRGYLECDGREVLRTMYSRLFDAIGVVWGSGDGATTFNLPDFRGRTTIGVLENKGVSGANANLMRTDRAQHMDDAYDTFIIPLSSNLATSTTYTIQLWDVRVRHTGKTDANIGLSAYLAGGSIQLATWNGVSTYYDSYDSNLHVARARYLKATFTTASSLASNGSIFLYNSVGSAAGYSEISIGKWKLEAGSNATPWTPNEVTAGFELADAGGERKFIMRTSQMPSHAHSQNGHSHTVNSHSHTVNGHTHPYSKPTLVWFNANERTAPLQVAAGSYGATNDAGAGFTDRAKNAAHKSTSSSSPGTNAPTPGTNSQTPTINATGGDSASPLMQPYAVVRKVIRAY